MSKSAPLPPGARTGATTALASAPAAVPRRPAARGAGARKPGAAARTDDPFRTADAPSAAGRSGFRQLYETDPIERVRLVKEGVPAGYVDVLARELSMPKEKLIGTLGLARATIDRKARASKPLSSDESSRVLGMARLVGQVQAMLAEAGDPQTAPGFDAGAWVARWLDEPLPALGGQHPGALMDTPEGQAIVAGLLTRVMSGAYA